jgi:DNA-directed RNA polymerase subunit N (RpoN/RPB10)
VRVEISSRRGAQSIHFGFTEQKLTPHAGLALMSQFQHQHGFRQALEAALPHAPTSPNAHPPVEHALGFVAGVLAGATKLTHVGHLRQDPILAECLGVAGLPSQSSLSRFFKCFSQSANDSCFGALFKWCAQFLPARSEGYTLDMDSTAILHEDGHQEGVRVGYTPRGLKPCHHPLLAYVAEAALALNFWLRAGHSATPNNAGAFLDQALRHLPAHARISLFRMDAGFCDDKLLRQIESRGAAYIVVASLRSDVKKICRHDATSWQTTDDPDLEVCERDWSEPGWEQARRLIILRRRDRPERSGGGKKLLDVPGYKFQALLTNLPKNVGPLAVWKRYNGRADVENRIKELSHQYGLKSFCCRKFWATEAALSLAVIASNLARLFQMQIQGAERVELKTLRLRFFTRAAIFSRAQGRMNLRFAIGAKWRDKWLQTVEKLKRPLQPDVLQFS